MKRRTVVLLTVVLAMLAMLVFSSPGLSQPPTPPGVAQLRQDAGGEVAITWNPRTDTPSFIRGRIPLSVVGLRSEGGLATTALASVDRYADLFGVRQTSEELNVIQTDVDALGMKHVTLGQVYQGIEVYDAYMKVHLSADGQEVVAISSGFVPDIELPDTQPRISPDQALAAARKALPNGTLLSGPKLVVYPGAGETPGASAKLAWLVELRDDSIPVRNVYVVEAIDGTMLDVLDRLYEQTGSQGIMASQSIPDSCLTLGLQRALFTLDGVSLELCSPFLPAEGFITSDPDNTIQVATAMNWDGAFEEFSITAVPFGLKPPTEDLPVAKSQGANLYRTLLRDHRRQQGGNLQPGPIATFFGEQVAGSVSVVRLTIGVSVARPVIIVEWVAEAGNRLWIFRVSQEVETAENSVLQSQISPLVNSLESISLRSANVDAPSTSLAAGNTPPIVDSQAVQQVSAEDLPFPSWWSGDCDTNNYRAAAGIDAYPLGASYRGVEACGPRPYHDGAPSVLVRFFPGAWGEYEWQCVELSMRFIYLAYDIEPYNAHGKDVVPNYSGDRLEKVNNGTPYKAPQPGDILSYGPNTTSGHTSVVIASDVNSQGNGTITVMEQNADPDGTRTHTVSGWYVQDSQTISGWLHDPTCAMNQYYAEYYNNRTLSDSPVVTRCEDLPIAYDWGYGGPGDGVGNDNFSVRWTGWFSYTEDTYNFVARTDDGIRVWVDGTLIIDAWQDQPPTSYQASHDLTAGEYEVRVEYYEHDGRAVAHVRWWGSTSDSDDGRLISSDETLWGIIEPSDDRDTYYFDANQDQAVTIGMTKSSFTPSLDPYLILYAPDGSEVARDDNSGGNGNALIRRVRLTQTGRFRIEAKSLGGASSGLYSLTMQELGRNRETYDTKHGYSLPGTLVRSEGDGPTGDQDVDDAHDFAGHTYDYYYNTHGRYSYDDQGATMVSTANYGYSYMNAFWNGEQTVYGDGFPVRDVVAHEWTHAVTEHSAELEYRWQSGALNESFSDIFGAMVDRDDWLMGEDLPPHVLGGREAIRDLSDPPRFGQPEHTDDWVETCSDNEGVHTNSGITNKAYYNIATAISKDKAERTFYRTLTVYLQPTSSLEDARAAALQSAEDLYGSGSAEYNAVRDGFNAVGLDGVWNPPPNDCCGASAALAGEPDGESILSNLRAVRDEVFTQDPGRRWTRIYYDHQFEVAWLLMSDDQLRADARAGFRAFDPVFRAGLGDDEAGAPVILTPELIEAAERALMGVAERGSPAVHDDIVREWEKVDPYRFVGWDVLEVWEQLRLEEQSVRIYLPIVLR